LLSATAIGIVLIVLVVADDRVRDHVNSITMTAPQITLGAVSAEVREVTSVLILSAKTQSLEHGPVVVFVTVAAVLVLAMVRS
jgi:hypothetical protein